jgi:hypothetical protein
MQEHKRICKVYTIIYLKKYGFFDYPKCLINHINNLKEGYIIYWVQKKTPSSINEKGVRI